MLSIIAILSLGIVALLIIGVFSCPSEDSFDSWLKSFLAFAMNDKPQPKDTQKDNSLWQRIMAFLQTYVFTSWGPTIMSNTIFNKRQFWHLGAFRLVFCTTPNSKQITFIGALNTWFPWGEKDLKPNN